MAEGYWKSHHQRAKKEATSLLWDESKAKTVSAIIVWAVMLALVWTFGDHSDVRSEIIISFWSTVALLIVLLSFYVWKFVALVPVRAKEQADELESIKERSGLAKPDLSKWLELDPLELEQVAWLWCGRAPAGKLGHEPDIMFQFSKLKRAIEAGDIAPDFPPLVMTIFKMQQHGVVVSGRHSKGDLEITAKTPVKVAELRRYAEAIGERPEFLFPKNAELSSAAPVGSESALKLAGLVRAISEQATQRDFKIPRPENDPFVIGYHSLKESADPVWIDATINQLRRDFLHACACVGDTAANHEYKERERWISETHKITKALIKALSGEA